MFADTWRACRLPVCGEPQKHRGLPVLVLIARCRTGSPWHRLTPGCGHLNHTILREQAWRSLPVPGDRCKSCLVEAVERVEEGHHAACALVGVATRATVVTCPYHP